MESNPPPGTEIPQETLNQLYNYIMSDAVIKCRKFRTLKYWCDIFRSTFNITASTEKLEKAITKYLLVEAVRPKAEIFNNIITVLYNTKTPISKELRDLISFDADIDNKDRIVEYLSPDGLLNLGERNPKLIYSFLKEMSEFCAQITLNDGNFGCLGELYMYWRQMHTPTPIRLEHVQEKFGKIIHNLNALQCDDRDLAVKTMMLTGTKINDGFQKMCTTVGKVGRNKKGLIVRYEPNSEDSEVFSKAYDNLENNNKAIFDSFLKNMEKAIVERFVKNPKATADPALLRNAFPLKKSAAEEGGPPVKRTKQDDCAPNYHRSMYGSVQFVNGEKENSTVKAKSMKKEPETVPLNYHSIPNRIDQTLPASTRPRAMSNVSLTHETSITAPLPRALNSSMDFPRAGRQDSTISSVLAAKLLRRAVITMNSNLDTVKEKFQTCYIRITDSSAASIMNIKTKVEDFLNNASEYATEIGVPEHSPLLSKLLLVLFNFTDSFKSPLLKDLVEEIDGILKGCTDSKKGVPHDVIVDGFYELCDVCMPKN